MPNGPATTIITVKLPSGETKTVEADGFLLLATKGASVLPPVSNMVPEFVPWLLDMARTMMVTMPQIASVHESEAKAAARRIVTAAAMPQGLNGGIIRG